jgi:hypothetical protein
MYKKFLGNTSDNVLVATKKLGQLFAELPRLLNVWTFGSKQAHDQSLYRILLNFWIASI